MVATPSMVYAMQTVMGIIVLVKMVIGARQIAINHTWVTSVQKSLVHPPQRQRTNQQLLQLTLGHLKACLAPGMVPMLVYTSSNL